MAFVDRPKEQAGSANAGRKLLRRAARGLFARALIAWCVTFC
jgi:hypothetical protein